MSLRSGTRLGPRETRQRAWAAAGVAAIAVMVLVLDAPASTAATQSPAAPLRAARERSTSQPAARQPASVNGSRESATVIRQATVRASEFDLEGALSLVDVAAARGDELTRVAALYLRGLIAARKAFPEGGDPNALAPVRTSLLALAEMSMGRPGAAETARLVLHAAAAAAQSERDEMRLYIESAVQMESLLLAAGQRGAPIVSAAELAGDFWLQVHRYDDARRAYADAAERAGLTLRILSGLARTARRMNEMPAACTTYRRLVELWGERGGSPAEISEARAYLGGCSL